LSSTTLDHPRLLSSGAAIQPPTTAAAAVARHCRPPTARSLVVNDNYDDNEALFESVDP
jgi:hypothetical protein